MDVHVGQDRHYRGKTCHDFWFTGVAHKGGSCDLHIGITLTTSRNLATPTHISLPICKESLAC